MTRTLRIECDVHVGVERKGRRRLKPGAESTASVTFSGRVPRVARWMALAIRFEGLLERGEIADCAELARLGHVTRARVSQIMALLSLAPDIQEEVLHLERVTAGRDPLTLRQLLPIAITLDWSAQRRKWEKIRPH